MCHPLWVPETRPWSLNCRARVGAQPDAGHAPQRHSAARFSPKARARLQAERLWIAINRPYYGRALFACPLIPAPSQPTMAIAMDHQWRIFINPEFVACSTVEKIAAVLIHEINHALRSHAERGRRTAHPALVEFWKAAHRVHTPGHRSATRMGAHGAGAATGTRTRIVLGSGGSTAMSYCRSWVAADHQLADLWRRPSRVGLALLLRHRGVVLPAGPPVWR